MLPPHSHARGPHESTRSRKTPCDSTVGDAGALLGYCADTTYDPLAGLEHELKSFNMMFSMKDMVQIDIILLDGNPLEGYWNWLKTKVTIKGGVVVVDKR